MKKFLLLLLITSYAFMSYSQSGLIRKETDNKGTVTFAEFQADSARTMDESKQLLKQLHALEKDEEFVLTDSKTDELGFTHQYFDQYYKGIRVAYSSYSVHGKDNLVNTVNGTYNKVGEVATVAKLSEKEALIYAPQFINAKVYKWEVPEEEQWLKKNYNESYYPKGELVIVRDRLGTNQQFRLAWKFDVYAHIPLSRNLIYVDAITGDILDTESKIYHVNSQGTAATRYSGIRNIVADSFTEGFRLRETRNNVRIETYNMRNQGTNYSGVPDFVDNNNNWTIGEFNNTNMDNAALDAHWGAEMVYDYFNTVHGRNSWNGSGGPLLNYVHTNLMAFGYANNANAFWDGQRMTYGDGNACHDPLTSLDIITHEIAHGINSTTTKMKYEGESGALNESLSDIWAVCVELWAASEKQTWLIGEDITLCDDAFRSMSNPNAHGQPNTYQTHQDQQIPFWYDTNGCTPTRDNDYCGVHTNSGIPNFWFFLLVNGGTGTNNIGNYYFVDGIGIDRAARIVYRAETVILASGNEQFVTFNQFRNATITAASNLYGANSQEVASVTNSWHSVGVGDRYQYLISGPSLICDQATYTIDGFDNLPEGTTVQWSVGSGTLILVSGQGTDVAEFSKVRNGITQINADISIGDNTIHLFTGNFWVGTPDGFNIEGPSIIKPYTDIPYHYVVTQGPYSYLQGITSTNWTSSPNIGFAYGTSGHYDAYVIALSRGDGVIRFHATNSCGTCTTDYLVWIFDRGLSLYPNPATDMVTVELQEAQPADAGLSTQRTPKNSLAGHTKSSSGVRRPCSGGLRPTNRYIRYR